MNFIRLGLFFANACAVGLVGTVATAQVPASDFKDVQARYQSHLDLVSRPLTDLGDKYQQALTNLQAELQQNADLDGLVAIRQELERFSKDRSPPAEVSKVEAVARLQKIFAQQHDSAREGLKDELLASHAAYRVQLERLLLRLTTAGEVDEALKVRAFLNQLGPEPVAKPTLETGLVLHLVFETKNGKLVRDASGTGNHGRLMGDASVHATGERRGSYAVFDGGGDFIECAHADSLTMTTDGSISLWVRPKTLQSVRGLVSKYTPRPAFTLRTWKDGGHRKVAFGDTSDNFQSEGELHENRWTHVVMTLDDGTVRFYLDGKIDSEGRRSAPLETNQSPLRIGSDYDGRYFDGAIDDVRIYQRALSAKEVAEIFQRES